jgi:anti-sigma regulatory factor (Ser/Thr protein kinase)
VPGLVFSSYYEPGKSEALIGGDWYDALRLSDGRLIVSIGDVSGSGLEAAVTMANVRQVIRGTGYVYPDPVSMLNAADKVLRAEHPDTIVTAFVGIIDPIERTMQFASAGHPPPFLRHKDGRLEELRCHGLVLGLRSRDEPPAQNISIEDGACLVFYTDGLTESRRSHEEGERRLRKALSDQRVCASNDVAKALHDAVLYDGTRDDVAILVVHFLEIEMGQRVMCWNFDAGDAAAVRRARLAFTERLRGSLTSEDIAAAELVFMELIGNVVRHAPGSVKVWIEANASSFLLHVIDRGPGFRYSSKLPLDPLSESGRGLFLISMLTEEFHVSRASRKGSHACAVLRVGENREVERLAMHA